VDAVRGRASDAISVLICGGGIAGVEGLLRLRRLLGDRVRLTLVTPQEELVYRPLAVRAPFDPASVRRWPLHRIAADSGARWIRDRVESIDPDALQLRTEGGHELPYDALLLALGARESAPYDHAHVFTDRTAGESFRGIVRDIDTGQVKSLAFVLAPGPVWPLPLYELALMTAGHARRALLAPRITFVTHEGRPLKAFGEAASEPIVRLLERDSIALHTGVRAQVPAPGLVRLGGSELRVDRIVTLPRLTGPAVRGIPAGTDWFVPIDDRCVVQSTGGRVFAAGDATDFPVKHGGIGAQQADTAAAGIAHLAGVGERPPPLRPVIRGMLLTGERPLYLAAELAAGLGWRSKVYGEPPWPAGEKVIAEELGPYLDRLDAGSGVPDVE
jgi:sulfide:quinone oxidoreductase